MLGGSIQPKKFKVKDVEPRAPRTGEEDPKMSWSKIMQRLAADEPGPMHNMQLSQFRDDLTNYSWINDIGYHQHNHWYQRHPEEELYKGAMPLFSGKGAAHDHPDTHKFFMESFSQHPELMQMYARGSAKPKQKLTSGWKTHHKQPHLQISHSHIR